MIANIIFQFVKDHPWIFLLNICLMVFVPINEVMLPYLFGKMMVNIGAAGALKSLVVLASTLVIAQSGFILRDKLNEQFVPRLESYIKTEIVGLILKKYNTAFDNITTGDLIYKMTKIPDLLLYWLQWINDYIIPYGLVFISAIFYFAKFDKWIAVTFFGFLTILMSLFYFTPKVCLKYAKNNDEVFSMMHEKVEDIIHNMPSILTSNMRLNELDKLKNSGENYSKTYNKTSACTVNFKVMMLPVVAGLVIFFVLRSRHLLLAKKKTKDDFIPMFVILTSMLGSIFWLIDITRLSVFDLGIMVNLNGMLEVHPAKAGVKGEMKERAQQSIGLRGVTFGYSRDKIILKDVSLDFEKGKSTALIGNIGAGKSTVIKLLLGLYKPFYGDLYLDGQWYSQMTIEDIRDKIGYVPQNPVLFNNSVLYNIQYGNDASENQVRELLGDMGIHPSFADKQVGKNGMNLSGGQRQLVWCLRVLFRNPEYLLMDEPTASMDKETKDVLLKLLKVMMKGKTVVIVTHDDYLLDFVDRKIELNNVSSNHM